MDHKTAVLNLYNIPVADQEYYYVDEYNVVYAPIIKNGAVVKTGMEMYESVQKEKALKTAENLAKRIDVLTATTIFHEAALSYLTA